MKLGGIMVPRRIPQHVIPTRGPEHVTDGDPCWCGTRRVCAECLASGPCFHGNERTEVVVHQEAS